VTGETKRVKARAVAHKPRRVQPPDLAEVNRIIRLFPTLHMRGLVACMAWSGLRVSEACKLRWEDVKLKDGVAFLHVEYGKGAGDEEIRERTAILLAPGVRWLPALPSVWEGRVFSNDAPRALSDGFSRHYAEYVWNQVRPRDLQHRWLADLRKFYATTLLDRGFTTEEVAVALGHFHRNGYPNVEHVIKVYGWPNVRLALDRIAEADFDAE
jgi:integrase